MLNKLKNIFSPKKEETKYQLVECKLDEEHFQQGIRLTSGKYSGVIFTTGPKVSFSEEAGHVKLNFKYNLEYKPKDLIIEHSEFESIVGDIILELIEKDLNASGTTDSKHSD
jgi:hypothetical protein